MTLNFCDKGTGEAFSLTVRAFLLKVELLRLQCFEVLIRRTLPL